MASVVIAGDVSGTCTLQAANAAGTTVLNLPTTSGTLVATGGSPTFTTINATNVIASANSNAATFNGTTGNITTVTAGLGNATAPAYSFTGDTNTGIFSPTADTIAFTEGGTEAMRINSSGGVQVLNCLGVGNATPSTSGAGITFPATQSASTDANTLDDYEEGTWTPTDASGAGLTLTINSAAYVKIGKMVYVACSVTYPSTGSGAGAQIGGMPFTVESGISTNGYWGGTTRYTTNSIMVMAATNPSSSSFAIYLGSGSQATNSYVSNLRYDFVFMYRATA